ncbi:uncharacterized protein [Drosophila tropicalis]|uniref:uncharacterized protein n=1 Tax=Drosophila tropicalis TaxID=46794 RepID=UPI0035ABAC3B
MSENLDAKAENGGGDEEKEDVKPTPSGTLKMSFADWKKCKEALNPDASEKGQQGNSKGDGKGGGRKNQQRNERNNSGGNSGVGGNSRNHHQDRKTFHQPLCRPPPLPIQLLSMNMGGGFGGNFGPPCGPPMMPPMNMGLGMGPGPGHGPGRRQRNQNHRPLQPPPFWEDMMSPQHRPPPIQPPMPKCPSLWNLVPKDKDKQRSPNDKYKPKNNNNNKKKMNNDAKLMPPPPPPPPPQSSSCSTGGGDTSSVSSSNGGQPAQKKKKAGGTFVQVNGQWVQKPEAPLPLEEAPPGTKEDRQRQWKEYRQAMKPFKNREFHNWKRTVQRLSKIPREQLDEQQLERLQKAEEYIGAHRAMLTIKHAERWVQQGSGSENSDSVGQQGQVYVRRPANSSSFWDQQKQGSHGFQRATPAKKQFFGTGRAIKGSIGSGNVLDSPSIGQYNQSANYFGLEPGTGSTNVIPDGAGMDAGAGTSAASGLASSFYSNYSSNFVKGDTLLPP